MASPTQKNRASRTAAKPEKKAESNGAQKPAARRAARPEAAKPEGTKPPAYMQAKLAVSHPQDGAEKEADQVARQVARTAREESPAATAKTDGKKAQRASLEPAVTPEKKETMALKPVPAAEKVQRRADAPSATPEKKLEKKEKSSSSIPQKENITAVQREAADPMAGAPVSAETENKIEARRGGGSELPGPVAEQMATQFNRDFSSVRVHNNKEAAELCAETNARAFTVGNDIFFAPGEFSPESDSGKELLAHELTHVVQQGSGAQRLMRDPAPTTPAADGGKGKGKLKGKELHIPTLTLPQKPGMEAAFTAKYGGLTHWKLATAEERTNQIDDWKKQIEPKASGWDLSSYISNDNQLPDASGSASNQYALKLKTGKGGQGYLIGTEADIRKQAQLPWWSSEGAPHAFDVDHILELQLGGEADKIENFQLLDASANRSSGSKIKNAIDKAIRAAVPPEVEGGGTLPDNLSKPIPGSKKGGSAAPAAGAGGSAPAAAAPAAGGAATAPAGGDPASAAMTAVKSNYDVIFDEVKFSGNVGGSPGTCWLATQVTAMNHMKPLTKATKSNAPDLYANDKLRLMPRPNAGVPYVTKLDGDPGSETFGAGTWGGMTVGGGTFNRSTGSGTINLTLSKNKSKKVESEASTLNFASAGIPTLCHIPPGQVAAAYRNAFKARLLSPIALNDADMDAGANIIGGGVLTIDGIPILAGTTLDVSLVGGDLVFSKTFSTDEFDMKGPIQLDSSSLTLSAGAATPIEASGLVEFHIGELAKGSLEGRADAKSFGMAGQLEFDKQLFTGSGRIDYDSEAGMKASGTLGLKPGALKGIKKANFTLAYDDSKKAIDFAGDAELSVPGFKGAKLSAHADDAGNISLGGEATLSDTIPRIKAGKLNVNAERKGDVWSLGGGGELEPDLSGLDASAKVKLDYKDGLLNGKLTANYKKSMVEGNVDLNAKAVIGEGGGEAEPLKVWGGGQVGVTAAPWLKATVGLTLDEKGEVTVAGELGLPGSLEIFPRKEINKQLFGLSTQIPIVPGIVAEVGGNLSAKAGIGPGALEQLKMGITYNPDHEEDTHITGDAHVKVPADAGLRLAARAGIGLGITGASATGGLELGGMLGIDGAAEATAHIDWMPKQGLQIDTEGYLHASPKFKFDVSGYVAVTALGFSVYDNRWELAAYELGSNLEFGVRFPIHYKEGQPFNVSLDDVKFEVPPIEPSALVRDLFNRIV